MYLLEIKNLYKSFSKKNYILKNINLSIDKYEMFCLVGPSGTGKSTLGRCILKLINYEGVIYFQNQDINSIRDYPRYVSFIPQEPMSSINPYFKTLDAILEPIRIMSLAFNEKDIKNIIQEVGIKQELLSKKIKYLSGGERQRVAIARAIITNPSLIIADEPTSSLDTIHKNSIGSLFLSLRQNSSIFIITHDIKFAQKFCDKIGIMYDGEIVEMGLKDDVFKSPKHEFTKNLLQKSLNCENYSYG